MLLSIYMIIGYCIGILNVKIYSYLLPIKSKLVILGSPKIWRLLLIWLRLKLGHLVLWHHKFGKIKCIIKSQIYGVLAVFSIKWWLLTMLSNPKVPISLILATAAYVLKITSGTYPPIHGNYSTNLKNLVKMMLSLDAHNRPSVHTILQMDFIKTKVN